MIIYLFLDTWFRITLRFNFSNVNISASISLKSSQNNFSNGGSSAVKTLDKPKQSYIYTSPLGQTLKWEKEKKLNIF